MINCPICKTPMWLSGSTAKHVIYQCDCGTRTSVPKVMDEFFDKFRKEINELKKRLGRMQV